MEALALRLVGDKFHGRTRTLLVSMLLTFREGMRAGAWGWSAEASWMGRIQGRGPGWGRRHPTAPASQCRGSRVRNKAWVGLASSPMSRLVFQPNSSNDNIQSITSGDWDVTKILSYDEKRNKM